MVALPYKIGKMILDYIEKTNNTFYGAYVDNDLKGSICVNEQGKISFLFVDKTIEIMVLDQDYYNWQEKT